MLSQIGGLKCQSSINQFPCSAFDAPAFLSARAGIYCFNLSPPAGLWNYPRTLDIEIGHPPTMYNRMTLDIGNWTFCHFFVRRKHLGSDSSFWFVPSLPENRELFCYTNSSVISSYSFSYLLISVRVGFIDTICLHSEGCEIGQYRMKNLQNTWLFTSVTFSFFFKCCKTSDICE